MTSQTNLNTTTPRSYRYSVARTRMAVLDILYEVELVNCKAAGLNNMVGRCLDARQQVGVSLLVTQSIQNLTALANAFPNLKPEPQSGLPKSTLAMETEVLPTPSPDHRTKPPRKKDIAARMLHILWKNREALDWSCRDWADCLECSRGTVGETSIWLEYIPKLRELEQYGRVGGLRAETSAPRDE